MKNHARFRQFAADFTRLIGQSGEIDRVSPTIGGIHKVENALADRPSISIHAYGANIGAVRRHIFDATGAAQPFASGYSSSFIPNFRDRSAEVRSTLQQHP